MMKLRVCGSAAMLLLFIAASLSICSAGAPSPALNKTYNVTLSQGQEVPPVPAGTPPSSGYALINFIGDKVNYKIYVYNATEVTLVSSFDTRHRLRPRVQASDQACTSSHWMLVARSD
eukprot:jgi/Botrbrau1/2219/Bobra.101_2s0048.1